MRKLPSGSNFGSANASKDGDGIVDANKKPSAGLDLVREKIDSFRTSQQQYIPGICNACWCCTALRRTHCAKTCKER